jgi:hypothetical protein
MSNDVPLDKRPSLFKAHADSTGKVHSVELPLFVTARDLVETHPAVFNDIGADRAEKHFGPGGQTEAMRENLIESKYQESSTPRDPSNPLPLYGAGLTESILKHGYNQSSPIFIRPPQTLAQTSRITGLTSAVDMPAAVLNGHHRLSVMFKHLPDHPMSYGVADSIWGTFPKGNDSAFFRGRSPKEEMASALKKKPGNTDISDNSIGIKMPQFENPEPPKDQK